MESEGEVSAKKCFAPMTLFSLKSPVKMCAPMVRYSKLPFRTLVRKYGCDLAFTPMIMSDSFVRSAKARNSEFSTNSTDRPLIVQFAANNPSDLKLATEIIMPYCDGIDLNCGCPQRWALQEGIGASLIKKPELLKDIVQHAKSSVNNPDFTVSVKIRIHDDLRRTVSLAEMLERIGISWLSVHGRTVEQRKDPVNLEAIKLIAEHVQMPVIANGDIKTLDDVTKVCEFTGAAGVMSARGILNNPAMFAGYEHTPLECVQDWVEIALETGAAFQTFHHHLMYMLENISCRAEKRVFNSLSSTTAVLDYLKCNYGITCQPVVIN